jgi:hypothetical protein
MRTGLGRHRRPVALAAAVFALCGLTLGTGALSAGAKSTAVRATPEIAVFYLGGDLQVKVGGAVIRSGGSIPAGSYMVLIYDDEYPMPDFQLTGPGVSIRTDMNSGQMGGLITPTVLGPYSFQTGATYRVEDRNIGAASVSTFTTTAPVASSGGEPASSGSSSAGSSSGSNAASTKKDPSTTVLGTLHGSVSAGGKPALILGGKTAKSLFPGRYAVIVDDRSTKAGFVVGQASKHPSVLSGVQAVGKTAHTLTLSSGKWFFQSSSGGAKNYFTVR